MQNRQYTLLAPNTMQKVEYTTSARRSTSRDDINEDASTEEETSERLQELYDCDQSLTIRFMGALGKLNSSKYMQKCEYNCTRICMTYIEIISNCHENVLLFH